MKSRPPISPTMTLAVAVAVAVALFVVPFIAACSPPESDSSLPMAGQRDSVGTRGQVRADRAERRATTARAVPASACRRRAA